MFKILYLVSILTSSIMWVILNTDGASNAKVSIVSQETRDNNFEDHFARTKTQKSRRQNQRNASCGVKPRNRRIIGGSVTKAGNWPWVVPLCYSDPAPGKYAYCDCAASLIYSNWALTAAHCIHRTKYSLFVGLEVHNVFKFEETGAPGVTAEAEQIFIHPQYDERSYENNIALIRLGRTDMSQVDPICLPTRQLSNPTYRRQSAWYAGWGEMNRTSKSEFLRAVQRKVVRLKTCQRNLPNAIITWKHICTGGVKGKGACYGDNGAPLMLMDKSGPWRQIGVLSNHVGCGHRNDPSVSTSISPYLDWIAEVTKKGF